MIFARVPLLFMMLLMSTIAQAKVAPGFLVNPGILYTTEEWEREAQNSSKAEITTTNLNINAGYSMSNNLILGAKYYDEIIDGGNSSLFGSSDNAQTETTSIGASIGMSFGELIVMASYMGLKAPEKTTANDVYSNGSGYIIDFSYLFDLGGWSMGPQLSSISFEYKKHTEDGVEDSDFTSLKETKLTPYFAFLLSF